MAVNTGIDGGRRRGLWSLAGWAAAAVAVLATVLALSVLSAGAKEGKVVRRTPSPAAAEASLSKPSEPAHDAHRPQAPG